MRDLGCYARCPLATGRHGGRPRCARVGGLLAAPGGAAVPLPAARARGAFFPSRGKEPKGDRGQPIRDSTMAAPGPLAAWRVRGTSCCARLIPSSRGRLGGVWCYACCPLAAGRHGGRPRCARVGGLLAALAGRGVPLPAARAWGLFFPTRGKEPKGDRGQPIRASTMAAPGPLAAWLGGRNLLLRKANSFLAGAA